MAGSLAPIKLNDDVIVPTTTAGFQLHSSVAALTGGGFVVGFLDLNPYGSTNFQLFAANGSKVGAPVTWGSGVPQITALADGGFVVVASWNAEARARVYEADGTPRAEGFVLSSDWRGLVASAVLSDGKLLTVSNTTDEIRIATHQLDGTPISNSVIPLPPYSGGVFGVTAMAGGGYIVAWDEPDGHAGGIFAQIFDGNGVAQTSVIRVNTSVENSQTDPSIVQLKNGNLVVVFENYLSLSAQILSPTGQFVGSEFPILPGAFFVVDPEVVALEDGGFLVTYAGGGSIGAQRYAADGTPLGDPIIANSFDFSGSPHVAPKVDQLADGNVVVSFTGGPNFDTDVEVTLLSLPPVPPPSFTSADAASFAENGTGVAYQASATAGLPSASLTYSLSGTDAGLFAINAATGAVTFTAAPDFEAPADDGGNNVYDITVSVSDGSLSASLDVAITVTDVQEVFLGTSGNDSLVGSVYADLLDGLGGNDTLLGNQGSDTLLGGNGSDSLDGGEGNDTLLGGLGADTATGGTGNDTVRGAAGNDSLDGGDGNDRIFGGEGNDTLLGGLGADTLRGDAGNDLLEGGEGNNRLNGGAGNDTLLAGPGNNTLTGGADADIFRFAGLSGSGTRITDFVQGVDLLEFSAAGFAGLSLGALGAGQFSLNSAAGTVAQFVYATGSGVLSWAADGSAGPLVQIARLTTKPALDASDFHVIA